MPRPSRGRSTGSGTNWTGLRSAPLRRARPDTAPSVEVDRLKPRQHLFLEPVHRGDRGFVSGVFEINIDGADAKAVQCPQIGDDVRCAAREEPALPVGGLARHRLAIAL